MSMTDVETDLETLRESFTPKQEENFKNHMKPTLDRLETVREMAEENGAEVDTEAARKWYLRTYRPKKRNDGLIKRDHVETGEPEMYFINFMEKLNSPWGSIQGLIMHGMFVNDETKEEIEDAATVITVAKHLGSKMGKQELARKLAEHEHINENVIGVA